MQNIFVTNEQSELSPFLAETCVKLRAKIVSESPLMVDRFLPIIQMIEDGNADSDLLPLRDETLVQTSNEYLARLRSALFKSGIFSYTTAESAHIYTFNANNVDVGFDDTSSPDIISNNFNHIIDLLGKARKWLGAIFPDLVQEIIPLRIVNQSMSDYRFAGSAHCAKGMILMYVPEKLCEKKLIELAIDMAHEAAHQAFINLLAFDRMILNPDTMVYSGARGVARPAHRSLHSAAALSYMIATARGLSELEMLSSSSRTFAQDRLPDLGERLYQNLASLSENCQFTKFGQKILNEINLQAQEDLNVCQT